MIRFTRFLLLSAILIAGFASFANAQAPSPKSPELFPLEDLRPGMKGTARTVFAGSDTQEFGVEVLGVLPGFPGPRQSAIIARLSGSNVEKTGVFAGMSGSPVYIDGKIVGAIAFSFPFSKEPIAGITPIKQMIDLFNKGPENLNGKEPRVDSFHNSRALIGSRTCRSRQSGPFRLWRRFLPARPSCRCWVSK